LGILEKLNNLKSLLKDVSDGTDTLPDEIRPEIEENFKVIRTMVNTAGGIIEKYFKDQRTVDKMRNELSQRMNELEIYKGLTDKNKKAIIEKVINDKDMVLVGTEELSAFIKDKLKTSSVDNLVKQAYSKKDIINLGDAVSNPESSEVVKYDAGMDVLRDMVKTPVGREDAITHGIKRLMGNSTSLQYYLMMYYQS